jgi:transcriptional regulator with XRE-family HTH domain
MSNHLPKPGYWAHLIRDLRQIGSLSQTELSDRLETDQGTVSRWERGISTPQHSTRKLIDRIAGELGLATLDDLTTVVRFSPFPMILVAQEGVVIAASATSGFTAGATCIEQTPEEERGHLVEFNEALAEAGFWTLRCSKIDYEFLSNGQVRCAVVIPISIRGEIYALVQKAW